MKIFFIILALAFVVWMAYGYASRVTFSDSRAHTMPLYCRTRGFSFKDDTPIIFVPGLKGTMLAKKGSVVWLTLRHLLPGMGEPLIYAENEGINPDGLFTRLWGYSFYDGIARLIGCAPNGYAFAYDWRQSPERSVTELGEFVRRVQQETGKKPHIIAHSLGGLIAHAYLKDHGDSIANVAYVGVPFMPGIGYLDDIEQGSWTGLNRIVMSSEAIQSQPVSYVLLPHNGSGKYKGGDILDAAVWKRDRLGPYKTEPEYPVEKLELLLGAARRFHAKLDTPAPLHNRFLIVTSASHRAVDHIEADGERTYGAGDGRVLESASYPIEMENLAAEVFFHPAPHAKQLNTRAILERIAVFLSGKRPNSSASRGTFSSEFF